MAICILLGAIVSVIGAFWASQKQAQFERGIRIKTEDTLAMLTGGDGFTYLHFVIGPDSGPRALLRNDGKYPVREVKLDIVNTTKNIDLLRAGKSYEERKQQSLKVIEIGAVHPKPNRYVSYFPFPGNDEVKANYIIHIDALNGSLREIFSMKKVKGTWVFAYRLFKIIERIEGAEKLKELNDFRYADSDFPRNENGEIDWLDSQGKWGLTNFIIVNDP